jgi:ankyrin repeat protein
MPKYDRGLFIAAESGRLDECKRLIEAGADPRPPTPYTPLMAAAANGQVRCVEFLAPLSYIMAVDEDSMNAAMHALACTSKPKSACHGMLRLIFAGLNPEQKERCCRQESASGETALYFAIHRQCKACAALVAPYSDILGKNPHSGLGLMEMAEGIAPEVHGILKFEEKLRRVMEEKKQLDDEVPCPQTIGEKPEPKRL